MDGTADAPTTTTWLIEHYASDSGRVALEAWVETLRATLAALSAAGHPARILGATVVPGDEGVLVTVEAPGLARLRDACERAGISLDRVSVAVDVTGAPGSTPHRETR